MYLNNLQEIPTFRRTRGPTATVQSVIDYIFTGATIHQGLIDTSITHLAPSWSDHAVLSATFHVGYSKISGGLWRANPAYVRHKSFQNKVLQKVEHILNFSTEGISPQLLWERIKKATGDIARKHGIKHTCWRKETLKLLEKKKNRILRSKPPSGILATIILPLMKQIQQLQQELIDIAALKTKVR